MIKKIDIGRKGKVNLNWEVTSIDYSHDKAENIAIKFADKYDIPVENVKVLPRFIIKNGKGEIGVINNEMVENIQDPKFQQKLFKQYLQDNNIENYDFDDILTIDSQINSLIDYTSYDKHKKYQLKWIKWSNFMSYGPDNFFEFVNLKGLVLLKGSPKNQSGKTTFCNDLIKFLFFGKVTTRDKDWTLADTFNWNLPEAKEVYVEGCLNIEGEDYIIKRTITRPDIKRRTEKSKVVQKLNYYKIVNGEEFELIDNENQEGETNVQTNQIIKEAIGNEKDFDLVICANSKNLGELISLKDTERGRLLNRWIGLLPLEEKEILAKEKFNKEINPKLNLNRYNKETLKIEIEAIETNIKALENEIKLEDKNLAESINKIENFEKEKEKLLLSKKPINDNLMKVDVVSIESTLKELANQGKNKVEEMKLNEKALSEIGSITFSEDEYKKEIQADKQIALWLESTRNECMRIKNEINMLKKGEYCPTCGAKLKNVDNTEKIKEKEAELNRLVEKGVEFKKANEEKKKIIEDLEKKRERYNEKNKLELKISTNKVDIANLQNTYKEKKQILKDLENNKTAIEENNKIETSLAIVNENIKAENKYKNELSEKIINKKNTIINAKNEKSKKQELIAIIEKEEKIVRDWKIYLELVGKNGISKIVLRNILPLINSEIKRLLDGVCDFGVEINIDNRNDVSFNLIRDGISKSLGNGSGFEQTVAGLALRVVLGNISVLPKPNFIILDEILSGVSDEKYDNIKALFEKICSFYSFIFHICHVNDFNEWHDNIITISKENKISKILLS